MSKQKVISGKNGETKEIKLGEIKITSHIYHSYQQLWIEMEDCSLEISPRWNNIDKEKVTAIAITAKKYPILKHEKNYFWITMYPNRPTPNDKGLRGDGS